MKRFPKIEKTIGPRSLALLAALLAAPLLGQDIAGSLQGEVVDRQGQGIAGATVKLVETNLTTQSGADGGFYLKGTFQSGILRRAPLPGGGRLEYRGNRLTWVPAAGGKARLIAPTGSV